jgi:hypothetical protein
LPARGQAPAGGCRARPRPASCSTPSSRRCTPAGRSKAGWSTTAIAASCTSRSPTPSVWPRPASHRRSAASATAEPDGMDGSRCGIDVPKWSCHGPLTGAVPMQITTIGLDLAKNVFQLHGVDAGDRAALRKRLSRQRLLEFFANLPRCLVGMEACGGAHFWARELERLGHDVRLMPASGACPGPDPGLGLTSSATSTTQPMRRRSARR